MVDVGRIPRWPIYGRKSNSTGWGKSRSDPQRNGKPKQFFVGEWVTVCDFHVFLIAVWGRLPTGVFEV